MTTKDTLRSSAEALLRNWQSTIPGPATWKLERDYGALIFESWKAELRSCGVLVGVAFGDDPWDAAFQARLQYTSSVLAQARAGIREFGLRLERSSGGRHV